MKEFRGKGLGHHLVEFVLNDVKMHPQSAGQKIYLNSQLTAMDLYEKSGFKRVGDMFVECEIKHYQMILEKKY